MRTRASRDDRGVAGLTFGAGALPPRIGAGASRDPGHSCAPRPGSCTLEP
nr:MAG TPA: hypothetical protein [Caudoviricetes sp.]